MTVKKSDNQEIWSFDKAPDPIPQKEIRDIIDADVVVIGAGISGVCAAISAAEGGARVIHIEKGDTTHTRGHGNAALGTRAQKEEGLDFDRDEVIAEIMRWGGYTVDQRLLNLWADNSGKVMDWILDMAKAAGIRVEVMKKAESQRVSRGHIKMFGLTHEFYPDGEETVMGLLESKMRDVGIKTMFNTRAVQLIRKGEERVTGVIAQTPDGYKQFNARAVILCTGGYEHDREMLRKYAPHALNALNWAYQPPLTTGDGHKMGMWVGAAMQEGRHCCVFEDGGGYHLEAPTHAGVGLPRQAWLNVNMLGERYGREDLVFGLTCNANMAQPGHISWVIWDGKWEEETKRMNTYAGRPGRMVYSSFHRTTPEMYQDMIKRGAILKTDTLDELVQKMGIPRKTFSATLKRYNEMARLGKDIDFNKDPSRLTTVEKPPFYAAKTGAALLVTLSGLNVNTKLQVLDKNSRVIPGLYAAGNTSGGFFAVDYPCNIPGMTHSRAFTFGRLAGFNAAMEKV